MDNIRAYGAGMAGGQFQLKTFFRKPTVLFRIFALIVGLGLWISISKGCWLKPEEGGQEICLFGKSSSTCSFSSAMGFFAVLTSIALLILDAKFENISSVPTRKRALNFDMALSAFLAFLFLITFFSLWSKHGSVEIEQSTGEDSTKTAILFALLSVGAWVGAAFFAWRRYAEGSVADFAPTYEQDFTSSVQAGPDYGYGGESNIGIPSSY